MLVEAVEMPDRSAFLCIARTVEGPQGGFDERPRRTALLLGCDISFRDQTVYGAALPGTPPTPIGAMSAPAKWMRPWGCRIKGAACVRLPGR